MWGKRAMKVQEIFTPNDTPTITYVDRSEHKLEETIRNYQQTPNVIVSISGPSKSGKTVLIKKVIQEDYIIPIVGAAINSADDLWDRALRWMGSPTEVTFENNSTTELGLAGEAGGKAGIPFIVQGEAKASVSTTKGWGSGTSSTTRGGGIEQVIKEIAGSEFVIFIDDFHYIKTEIREDVGRQIKVAAERGIKFFTASVPHRSDDVVRSNPELRGRVAAVDLEYWTIEELSQILRKGFAALNVEIAPAVEMTFASEAFGSPQLMQSICLNLCYTLGLKEEMERYERVEISHAVVAETLLRTSKFLRFLQDAYCSSYRRAYSRHGKENTRLS
jgi:hypothetical protein